MANRWLSWSWGESGEAPRALTIGVFDGVHLGHRALLERLRAEADARRLTPTVLTFDPHPLAVVAPEKTPEKLVTGACRLRLLRESGAAAVASLRFDREVAALPPEDFVREVMVRELHTRLAVVSAAFRFGAGARGDVAALRRIGGEQGIEVVEVPPRMADARRVSSTRIRTALRTGDVEAAARLLGRPHLLEGLVVRGLGRGRTLGFPTANLEQIEVMLPAEGTYAAWARWDGKLRPAAVHVGRRLTFEEASTVEAHLLDTDADLYGRRMTLAFVQRLRDDARFDGPQSLAAQIARDVATVRTTLGPLPPPAALQDPGACGTGGRAGG